MPSSNKIGSQDIMEEDRNLNQRAYTVKYLGKQMLNNLAASQEIHCIIKCLQVVKSIPLTCHMFTIFSVAPARYLPLMLQQTRDKLRSLGDPRLSSESPSL